MASIASIPFRLCIATGAMAWSSAVVCERPLGPPKSSQTRLVKPRVIERPTRLP